MSAGRSWLEAEQGGAQAGQDGLRARGSASEKGLTFPGEPLSLPTENPDSFQLGCASYIKVVTPRKEASGYRIFLYAEITLLGKLTWLLNCTIIFIRIVTNFIKALVTKLHRY